MSDVQEEIRQGTSAVFENNRAWGEAALEAIRAYATEYDYFTSEALRLHVVKEVGNPPGHPSAWGALILKAKARGFITPTGERPFMTDRQPNGHGRITSMYLSAI